MSDYVAQMGVRFTNSKILNDGLLPSNRSLNEELRSSIRRMENHPFSTTPAQFLVYQSRIKISALHHYHQKKKLKTNLHTEFDIPCLQDYPFCIALNEYHYSFTYPVHPN